MKHPCIKHRPLRLSKDGRCLDCRNEAAAARYAYRISYRERTRMAEAAIDWILTQNNLKMIHEECKIYREHFPKR